MKTIFTLGLAISLNALQAQNITWSPPLEVNSSGSATRPRIALASNQTPVVTWGTTGSSPVYTGRFNGSGFDTKVRYSALGHDPFCNDWTGPDIAASGDSIWVVYDAITSSTSKVYTALSTNGGQSYGAVTEVGTLNGKNRFPSLTLDGNNPVISIMGHNGSWNNSDYQIVRSINGGVSFLAPVSASYGINGYYVCDCCPAEVICSGNEYFLLYRSNISNNRDIWLSKSENRGGSFAETVDIDDVDWMLNACPSTGPHSAIKGDSIIATWYSDGDNRSKVRIGVTSRSSLLSAPSRIIDASGNNPQAHPRISADQNVVAVVYQESNANGIDVYLAYSMDGDNQLDSTHVCLTCDIEGNQKTPDIIYKDGFFHVVYINESDNKAHYIKGELHGLGISEKSNFRISSYPNPSQGQFTLHVENYKNEELNLQIFDMEGKLQHSSGIYSSFNRINTSLSSGIYTIQVLNNNFKNIYTNTIIIE